MSQPSRSKMSVRASPHNQKSNPSLHSNIPSLHSDHPSQASIRHDTSPAASPAASNRDETNSASADNADPNLEISRDRYHPPDDPLLRAHLTLVNEYLRKTEIEDLFNSLLKVLLARTDLPYNPYPGFVRRFRVQAERFHLFAKSHEEIKEILNNKCQTTPISFICRPVKCDFIWGLPSIVSMVEPDYLKQYLWLLNDLIPKSSTIARDPGYSISVMPALVGPSLFHGSVYGYPHSTDVRVQYLISGSQISRAVAMFIESVVQDVTEIEKATNHTLLGIKIPVAEESEAGKWTLQLWSYESIMTEKQDFWRCASEAIAGNKYLYAECVFCLNAEGTQVIRGQKQYSMFFTQVHGMLDAEKELSLFTEFPLVTLYEGIFTKQNHAESYLVTYTPRDEIPDAHYFEDASAIRGISMLALSSSAFGTVLSFLSAASNPNLNQRGKVKIDGFKIGDNTGHGPQSWQVKTPIISHWQRQIASMHSEAEFFNVVYYALLLTLMDRDAYDETLLSELYRVLHSTAARVYQLMQLNKTIRELISKFEGNSYSSLVMKLFMEYRRGLRDLSDTTLQEWSSDLTTSCGAVLQILEELVVTLENGRESVPLERKSVRTLKNANSYTSALLLHLTEDTLASCPNLQSLIQSLHETFPEDIALPKPAVRDHRDRRRTAARAGEGETIYKHGIEEEAIIKHEEQVINIEMCMERDNAPKAIAVDNILLKYIVDTHLDEVWPQFLVDLLSGPTFPPNPFPKLVTVFRQCAMKMDLCYEKAAKVLQRLMHGAARVEDPEHHIYHIPGCDAHGLLSAMCLLDSNSISELLPLVEPLVLKNFMLKRGPYRVAICTAVSGPSTLYGRMDPYLREIQLDEHYYVRGPDGCSGEARQIYSRTVHDFLKTLHQKGEYIISGIYLGSEEKRWSIEDALERKKGFAMEFETCCGKREPVFVKVYVPMDWRLVPVIKFLKFHFLNDDETDHGVFYPVDPSEIYTSVFFDAERAAFHVQYNNIKSGDCAPFSSSAVKQAIHHLDGDIQLLAKRQDWISVHRLLLTRNLIAQGTSLIVEAWRMFHSMAAQIEYVNHLGHSLQDLVHLYLELESRMLSRGGSIATSTFNRATSHHSGAPTRQSDHTTLHTPANAVSTSHNDAQSPHLPSRQSGPSNVQAPLSENSQKLDMLESSMSSMVMAYRQKIEKIVKSQVSMATKGLLQSLQTKMARMMERDEVTRELFVIPDMRSVFIIDEINNVLQELQDCLAHDVHCTCSESQAVLRSIQSEYCPRPSSVASIHLSDPGVYSRRPKANKADHSVERLP